MSAASILRAVIFRHPDDQDVRDFETAVACAFKGGKEPGAYVAAGADIGVQLEIFGDAPPSDADAFLDSFCHTLVIVLVDRGLLERSPNLLSWLAQCFTHVADSGSRHGVLVLAMEERLGSAFARTHGLGSRQVDVVQSYGERALRPSQVALRALHEARILLASAMPSEGADPPGFLRLFISHAKLDGLPLALSLRHHIKDIRWLQSFYDADDLPAGSEWQKELERGVGNSLIIMLRTEEYDERYWCQQEVKWADEYVTPTVLVEARTNLNHPATTLPFGRAPIVRIPDGNLMRVLFLALREGLKYLLFARRVDEMRRSRTFLPDNARLRVLSLQPSMAALLRASRQLAQEVGPRYILYPDPPLGTGDFEAAQALVAAAAPGVVLATPETLATAGV